MVKVHTGSLIPEKVMRRTLFTAQIATLAALSNLLSLVSIPIVLLGAATRIHFTQLPILTAALGIGPLSGGLVGAIGAIGTAFTVTPVNPFIILYNGMLGFFAGLFFIILKRRMKNLLATQMAAVVAAYLVQTPFIWTLNTQVMRIPAVVVQVILLKLLLEDLASTLVNHPILNRINLIEKSRKRVPVTRDLER